MLQLSLSKTCSGFLRALHPTKRVPRPSRKAKLCHISPLEALESRTVLTPWTALTNLAPIPASPHGMSHMILLSDGTVMATRHAICQERAGIG